MTSLLPDSRRADARGRTARSLPSSDDLEARRHRRPLLATGLLGGAAAAVVPLAACLVLAVIGWYASDAGSHGTPVGALRVGALGWLVAHGSGVHVGGVAITALPLGLTLACAFSAWRAGLRVGDAVCGHGPDADGLADGDRDWVVPLAATAFAGGYLLVGAVTFSLAGSASTRPDATNVAWTSLVITLVAGLPGIAAGSGRAAVWAGALPGTLVESLIVARRLVVTWLAVGLAGFLVGLALHLGTAANLVSQLHTGADGAAVYSVLSLAVVPNAAVFSGSYLLGPGFTMGLGTLVAPGQVVLGPLPMFPLLAALPSAPAPGWTPWLVVLAPLVAAWAVVQAQRGRPTLRWTEGLLRGGAGGVLAGIAFGLLAGIAGGAVGPGRMRDVAPLSFDVLVHGVALFGLGGLLGGALVTFWQRRAARVLLDEAAPE